ncbi:hypothetical protein [Kibdelosporangium philippinense]|uniref:hypothetical protein n=1 Tax=Kibdelosporangium philippinense TaxID=211113 RepID=UPI00361B5681
MGSAATSPPSVASRASRAASTPIICDFPCGVPIGFALDHVSSSHAAATACVRENLDPLISEAPASSMDRGALRDSPAGS